MNHDERIPFISPSRTLNYFHKSHTNGESIQQINRIGLIFFHSWTKPTNSYWILSTKVSNLLERISKRNNGVIWIMGNNGGVGEITHTVCMGFVMHSSHWPSSYSPLIGRADHAFLMLSSHWLSWSCISHALLSLAELMLSSHWPSWSCISHATTKVQP